MSDLIVLVSLFELLVGVALLGIATVVWGYRNRRAGVPLLLLLVSAAVWSFSAGAASLLIDPGLTRAAQFATYSTAGVVAVSWFYVATEYADLDARYHPMVVAFVAGVLVTELLVLASNPFHHLYITQASEVTAQGLFDPTPGPLFLLYTLVKVGFVTGGIGVLVSSDIPREGILRVQTTVIVVSGLAPVAAALVELFDLVSIPGFDISVIGLAVSATLLTWALFDAELLDVTPLARSTVVRNLSGGIVVLDPDDRVIDMNPRARSILGIDGEAIGRPALTILPDFHRFTRPDGDGDGDGDHSSDPADLTTTVDGADRHYEVDIVPLWKTSGVLGALRPSGQSRAGTLVMYHDVTDRRERERLVEEQNERLERFASVVSHDLRNPLSVATAWLEVARETDSDNEQLATVARAHTRMGWLIDDLLTLARSGQSITEIEAVSLREAVERYWSETDTEGARLAVETTATIRADRRRLEQLLGNLLSNAVTHGGESVSIRVGTLDDGTGFYVADDGPGIPPEERDAVFEWGYRQDSDGSGLGLGIVAEIARAHGWAIAVSDSADGGTRFEITGVDVVA